MEEGLEASSQKEQPSGLPMRRLRDEGLLWLINTAILHPRGLALALHFDGDEDEDYLEVLDYEEYVVFSMDDAQVVDVVQSYLSAEQQREQSLTGIGPRHILDVADGYWTIDHPLVCRRTYTNLLHCEMHQSVIQYPPDELSDGRYILTWSNDRYLVEALDGDT